MRIQPVPTPGMLNKINFRLPSTQISDLRGVAAGFATNKE